MASVSVNYTWTMTFYYIRILKTQKALEIPFFAHCARYDFLRAKKNLEFAFSRESATNGHTEGEAGASLNYFSGRQRALAEGEGIRE